LIRGGWGELPPTSVGEASAEPYLAIPDKHGIPSVDRELPPSFPHSSVLTNRYRYRKLLIYKVLRGF